jgi:hypothetical protein
MSVDHKHPEYQSNIDKWEKVRNVINSDVEKYIRTIDVDDPSRSRQYREDAILTNFTARTEYGLVGSVFSRVPDVSIPSELSYLEEDATGDMLPMNQLAQKAVGDTLQVGRFGILADYPEAEQGLTQQEVEDLNLKARLIPYNSEKIINWNTERVGGDTKLTLVVLLEEITELLEDGFTWEKKKAYRVLRLEEGIYTVTIYDDEEEIVSYTAPSKADGSTFDFIPFFFIGSKNNDHRVDRAPLYDLACLNIGHLKNSADYEESVHVVGQPTLFLGADISTEQFLQSNPNGVKIGARAGHFLGANMQAQLLQPQPNQLADVAMSRKEQQAIMIGARLITNNGGVETAEAARIRYSSENSALLTIVQNVSAGLQLALEAAYMFMSTSLTEDIKYELNTQFYDKDMDPNLIMAQIQLLNEGLIAKKDVRDNLRMSGIVDVNRTDDELDAEAEEKEQEPMQPSIAEMSQQDQDPVETE